MSDDVNCRPLNFPLILEYIKGVATHVLLFTLTADDGRQTAKNGVHTYASDRLFW